MKGAVLFDLDGTLWDSTAAIVPAWNRVLGKWGKTVTQADMAGIMGLTDREIAARFLPGLPEDRKRRWKCQGSKRFMREERSGSRMSAFTYRETDL